LLRLRGTVDQACSRGEDLDTCACRIDVMNAKIQAIKKEYKIILGLNDQKK
jgi:hypothetical protein